MKLSQAQIFINNAISIAQNNQQQIAVAVTDDHGELLCFARMEGASLHAGVLAQNKAYTSARDRQSTASLAAWAQQTGKDMGYWSDARFTGIQGGLPIYQEGQIMGAIGVSGLSEEDDEALAKSALET